MAAAEQHSDCGAGPDGDLSGKLNENLLAMMRGGIVHSMAPGELLVDPDRLHTW